MEFTGLARYTRGTMVSTAPVRTAGGTLMLFAPGEGHELSHHTAPPGTVIVALEGREEVIAGGHSIPTGPGQAVLLPADIPPR